MTYTFLKAPPKIPPHPSSWLRNSIAKFILFGCCITLNSCYKDTRTCHCARQPRFNLKDDCREAEQFIGAWAEGIQIDIVVTYHPDVERFMPEYNPKNANELAFILKIRTQNDSTDKATQPMLVVANLLDGSHRFIHELPFKHHDRTISWSRNNHIVINNIGQPSLFIDASNGQIIDSTNHFFKQLTWSYNGDYVVGWTQSVDTRRWGLGVLSWPLLEKLETKFESFPLPTTASISWSQENEIVLPQENEIGKINFKTSEYNTIFSSDAELDIGMNGGSGVNPDYQWAPNNKDVYFSNSTGIFKVRIGDDKQYRIKKNCPNRQYQEITVSPEGDKIIAQRRDIETEDGGEYISENIKLVIMNVNGCNEEVLFEDWDGVVSGRP